MKFSNQLHCLIFTILFFCFLATASAAILNLRITSVNGSSPVLSPETNQFIINSGSTVIVSWDYDNSSTQLLATLRYINPALYSYNTIVSNINVADKTFSIVIPSEATSNEAKFILETSTNTSEIIETPTFTTLSLCEADPTYCGSGSCNDFGQCECVDNFSGPQCNISPCASLGCSSANTSSCSVESDGSSPLCVCNSGFTGFQCELLTQCQTLECANGGFVAYTTSVSGSYLCESSCTCLQQWQNKATGVGCTECDLSCKNNGVLQTNCRCNCQPGFTGPECASNYALGKIIFENTFSTLSDAPEVVKSRMEASLLVLVMSIMQLSPAEIRTFGSFASGDDFNIVFMFPYASINASSPENVPTAPRGIVIRNGWVSIQNDVSKGNSSLIAQFLQNIIENTPPLPASNQVADIIVANNKNNLRNLIPNQYLKSQQATLAASPAMVLPPGDLFDPNCHLFFSSATDDNCPNGSWPMNYPEPFDKTNDSAIKWWVFGLAIGCIGATLLLVISFYLFGSSRYETAASMENESQARASHRDERLQLLADLEEKKETQRLEAKRIRSERRNQVERPGAVGE